MPCHLFDKATDCARTNLLLPYGTYFDYAFVKMISITLFNLLCSAYLCLDQLVLFFAHTWYIFGIP